MSIKNNKNFPLALNKDCVYNFVYDFNLCGNCVSDRPQNKHLKPFTKDYRPKNPGRKPSHLKKYLKENGVGLSDVRKILSVALSNCKTIEDMKNILKDPNTPPIVFIPVKVMINELIHNKMDAYKFLLEYAYGMPKQQIESDNINTNTNLNIAEMTHEEREEIKQRAIEYLAKQKEKNENNTDQM